MGRRRRTFPWMGSRGLMPLKRRRLGLSRKITALDIDGDSLRVVQTIRRGRRIVVTRFAAEQLQFPAGADQTDPAVVGPALNQALQRLRLRPGSVVMGVPRTQVILRSISIPPTTDFGEMASMVNFQIAKDLPFRPDEAVVDFKVHGPYPSTSSDGQKGGASARPDGSGEAKTEVLVAAVQNDVLQTYQRLAEEAGFKLAALGLRSYANARCVEACQLTEGGAGVALVSLRPGEVIIDVLERQALVFSRVAAINPPSNDPPLASEEGSGEMVIEPESGRSFASMVTIEVVRSLHSYEATVQQGRATKVVVSGSTGQEEDVVAHLKNRLSVPCSVLDPSDALGLPESQRHHAPGALAVFGLGLGMHDPGGLPFDFLNPKRPPSPGAGRRTKWIMAAAAGVVLLVGLGAVRHRLIQQRLEKKAALLSDWRAEEEKRPTYLRLPRQAAVVEGWMKEEHSWLDHSAYLSKILPSSQEVYVSSLTVNNKGDIRLALQARTGEILAQLDRQLRAAGYEVKPLAINPAADKHGYPFKTTVELQLPPRMQIEWTGEQPASKGGAARETTPP